jgi:hypothetical protein
MERRGNRRGDEVRLSEQRHGHRRQTSSDPGNPGPLVRRSLLLSIAILLLTAALTVPLRSNQHLYEFTRFVEFGSLGKIWEYFSGAMPVEVTIVAMIGAVIGFRANHFHSRVLALWLPLAALVSIVAGGALRDLPMLAQFEGPRLLPLVRLPALFLAAIAIHTFAQYILRRLMPTTAHRWADIGAVADVCG